MKCSLGISDFLDEISSLYHSVVFLSLCLFSVCVLLNSLPHVIIPFVYLFIIYIPHYLINTQALRQEWYGCPPPYAENPAESRYLLNEQMDGQTDQREGGKKVDG